MNYSKPNVATNYTEILLSSSQTNKHCLPTLEVFFKPNVCRFGHHTNMCLTNIQAKRACQTMFVLIENAQACLTSEILNDCSLVRLVRALLSFATL